MLSPTPPPWPHCADGASPADPVGCRGIHIPGHLQCLEHLPPTDQASYMAGLIPGSGIDLRGTRITSTLLMAIFDALRDPRTSSGHPRFGIASFDSATFTGPAVLARATFSGDAGFDSATFTGDAYFQRATFTRSARFDSATFTGNAGFASATFTKDARFGSVTFTRDAGFNSATFEGLQHMGPLRCSGRLSFDQARFTGSQVTLEAAARIRLVRQDFVRRFRLHPLAPCPGLAQRGDPDSACSTPDVASPLRHCERATRRESVRGHR